MGVNRRPSRVELEIGELRLTGFGAREGRRIGRAVERELAQLMASADLAHSRSMGHLNTQKLRFAAATRSETIGARIAQAVFHRLTGAQE